MLSSIKNWAKKLKSEIVVLYFAYQDKRVPKLVKILAICVVAYAVSPIDLIPDFIPVLGFLDDIILLPLGIALAIKGIPDEVLTEYRQKVQKQQKIKLKPNWIFGIIILMVWLLGIGSLCLFLYQYFVKM